MESRRLEHLKQIADAIAAQFGDKCEVVIHDLGTRSEYSVAYIVNSHMSGQKVGDGASLTILRQLKNQNRHPQNHQEYLTRTEDGRILKCSSTYLRNTKGEITTIFSVNLDITELTMMKQTLESLIGTGTASDVTERTVHVSDVLDNLIEQSVALVGKPVALMHKADKMRAIKFLYESGAFLVTRSGDKVAKYFDISKYTLYSYIDANKEKEK